MWRRASVLSFALLLACDPGGFSYEPARATLLRETVDVVILPGYRDVASAATTLRERTESLCDGSPDAAGVTSAREAWATLFLAWEGTSAYQFGPTRDLNLGAELAFWPTRPDTIEATITGTAPLDPAGIELLGAAGLGIFALEYLLFQPAPADEVATALAAERRCAYLVAVAGDAERLSARIVTEWTPYGELLATAATAGNGTFPSQLRAMSTLFTQLLTAVSTMKNVRLDGPLGAMAGGVAQPDRVRSPYAHLSNEGLLAELEGARRTWTAGVDGHGMGGYLAMRDAALAAQVLAEMEASRAALDAVPDPLEGYVVMTPHPLADEARAEVATLERTLGTFVATRLSLSVTFTDSDGD